MRKFGKRVLSFFITLSMMLSVMVPAYAAVDGPNPATASEIRVTGNSDLSGHWAEAVMKKWVEQGLLNGTGDGRYLPDQRVTRAEFAAFLNRVFQFPTLSGISFSDVPDSAWYAGDVRKAAAAGITQGVGQGRFAPDAYVTREDAAVMMARAFRVVGGKGEGQDFADAAAISSYAKEAVKALHDGNYLQGAGGNRFLPKASITRAETVQLMNGVMGTLIGKPGTFNQPVKGNLVVNAAGVVLKGLVVEGDLYIAPGVGEGEVALDGVTVQGKIYALGGGENSIKLHNVVIQGELVVDKWNSQIRIVVSGDTQIASTMALSGAILEESKLAEGGSGFVDIETSGSNLTGPITLRGIFEHLVNRSGNARFAMDPDAVVRFFTAHAVASVEGEGTIESAELLVNGVNLGKRPLKTIFGDGIWAMIEQIKTTKEGSAPVPTTPPTPPATSPEPPGPTTSPEPSNVLPLSIWVPTNVEKIRRDQAFPAGQPSQELQLEAARNEYEGGQIIVRTTEASPVHVAVSVSPLAKQDGTTIEADHIQVFKQHYIEVATVTSGAFPAGFYPDALIPVTASDIVEVRPDRNQGFWFTVQVPKGQAAGIYSGFIKFEANGRTRDIPIKLEVWDFELSDESHTQTAFAIWNDQVAQYHGVAPNTPEYWELLDNYYWMQTEYRLPPDDLPIPTDDVDQYIAMAGHYLDDPRVNSFRIPFYDGDPDKTKELVDKLRDKGWLSKGYFYIIDEPSAAMYPVVKQYAQLLKQIAPDAKFLLTKQPVPELYEDIDYWVSPIGDYDRSIAVNREANGEHFWWYTMVHPTYPFVSYHIDDLLIGARLLSWMQKENKVEGNLYWSTTIFRKISGAGYGERDVWNDPLAFPGANGDGFLLYPGKDLGLNKPIPSLRLETIRDGMEDYEYLWLLEDRMKSAASELGLNDYDVDAAMKLYYDRLYKRINDYNEDPGALTEVRREVAAQIVSLAQDPVMLYTVAETGETTRELTIYTEPGASLQVNGVQLQPQQQNALHDMYLYPVDASQSLNVVQLVSVKGSNANTWIVAIARKPVDDGDAGYFVPLNDAESQIELERWTNSNVTATLSNEHATNGGYSMKVDFQPNVEFPNIRMQDEGKGFVSKDWSPYKDLRFQVYNPGDKTVVLYVKFADELGNKKDGYSVSVAAHTHETVMVPLFLGSLDKTRMKNFEIWVWQSPESRTLYFDDFQFTANEQQPTQRFPLLGQVETILKDGELTIDKAGKSPFKLFMMNTGESSANVTVEQLDPGPLQLVPVSGVTLAPGEFETLTAHVKVPPTLEDDMYTIQLQVGANGSPVQLVTVKVNLKRNLIRNPGFEQDLGGWYIPPAYGGARDTTASHSGGASLKVASTYYRTDQQFVLEPGKPYTFSAWMKAETAGTLVVQFTAYQDRGSGWVLIPDDSSSHMIHIGTDWTYVELTYTRDPAKDYEFDFVNFWINDSSTGAVWMDDAQFQQVSGGVAVVSASDTLNIGRSGSHDFQVELANTGEEASVITLEQADQGPLQLVPGSGMTLAAGESATWDGEIQVPSSLADGTYEIALQVMGDGVPVRTITIQVNLKRNLIHNPGFEQDLAGWYIPPAYGGVRDTTASHSGGASLKVASTYFRTDQQFVLEPGKPYTFSAWMKAETAGTLVVQFTAYQDRGSGWVLIPDDSSSHMIDIGTDWTYVELTYTRDPAKDYEFDFVNFWLNDSSTGAVWMDDAQFKLAEP